MNDSTFIHEENTNFTNKFKNLFELQPHEEITKLQLKE